MDKIYVFGHQKPDTDAITSAISLAYLKKELGYNTVPCRIGDVNQETKYVLDYFNVKEPMYLEDVKLQLKDINYHKNYLISYHASIKDAYDYMMKKNITGVPCIDEEGKLVGLATVKHIVNDILNGDMNSLNTSYENILNTLEGETLLHFDDEIKGEVLAAAYRSTTFMSTVKLTEDNILIVGDRHSVIEYAISRNVKLIIISGNGEIKEEHLKEAKKRKINIIRTNFDTFKTTKLIGLANYIERVAGDEIPYTFNEEDYYDEFLVKTAKLKHNNYPVIGKKGKCLGLIRITDITDMNKKKVILVDHNETEQSVEGLEEAEIVEVVDHHKIGNISTKNPINFRNMSVGSSNTIVYEMFKESNITIPREIAGIMLAGILSDTLILTSPTTTNFDKEAVDALSKIVKVDYEKFALEMFKVGTSLNDKTIAEIVNTDIKEFNVESVNFAVSQVFTMDIDSILKNKNEYIDYIDSLSRDRKYKVVLLVVTDIIKNGSYLLYTTGDGEIISDAFGIDANEGIFIDGVVSRKKQIIPKLMDVVR